MNILQRNIMSGSRNSRKTGIETLGPVRPGADAVLSAEALEFIADLERKFGPERRRLMKERTHRQRHFDSGELPDFLAETAKIRESDWAVAPAPAELQDRRVEITGPVDRKMMINALNCGANVFMADLEDSLSPTWDNVLDGHVNLYDHARGWLGYTDPVTGKEYRLKAETAVLMVRPRGLHLEEAHVLVDGRPISAALFDFGLHAFLNAPGLSNRGLIDQGSGLYYYLPKLEHHLEARLWDDVLSFTEDALGLEAGAIKVTVLIETLPAAFQMHEILHALKDHIVGLNCGRWDYIFSFIKRLRARKRYLLPDRGAVSMDKAFLRAYSLLLIQTCHKRGAHAMGGMAAQIPVKGDDAASRAANDEAFAKVRADKEREARDGHDGTWAAHPALVPVAKEAFDRFMPGPNQIADKPLADLTITRDDLLEVHKGEISDGGLRENICVGVQYIAAWLSGRGAVPLYNLMEDAATAEISRAQVWQWIRHRAKLADGRTVTEALVREMLDDEMSRLKEAMGGATFTLARFPEAMDIFWQTATGDDFEEFLTIPSYQRIILPRQVEAAE